MALDQTANFVRVDVSGTHNSTATTVQLESGQASQLPDPANGEYNLVWWDDTFHNYPSADSEVEIVRVTGRDTANDTITVLRGQEDTTAVAHDTASAQYRMVLAPTSKMFADIEDVTNLSGSAGTAGQFLQSDGTNLSFSDVDVPDEVVIQDTEPSNPFEGLWWYDTGSNTMQYYDGTQFIQPGNTIDGTTITENANGDIQVSKPSEILIDTFELGVEEYQGRNMTISTSTSTVYNGNQSLNIPRATTQNEDYAYKTLDVSGIDKVQFWYYLSSSGMNVGIKSDISTSVSTFKVKSYFSQNGGWFQGEIDVSQHSGEFYLFFATQNSEAFIDEVKIISERRSEVDTSL